MSDPIPKKSTRKKKASENDNLVSNFISKKEDSGEPKLKKPKKSSSIEDDPDDSLKLFKTRSKTKINLAPQPSTSSSSNCATSFINESGKKPASKPRSKPASKITKRKPKAQPDIRKVLSKQEMVYQHLVTENCLAEGTDPEEMQLALAISESLKDQIRHEEPEASTSSGSSSKFENPFTTIGKVQPISAMLERFGFKSKKVYTEYELDLIINSKIAKRSKFQKFPTALTRTSTEKRNGMIGAKIDRIMSWNNADDSLIAGDDGAYKYEVFSYTLQELQEKFCTVFQINSDGCPTDEILHKYFITDLFAPSFVPAGHLLKDWSLIPGRDLSPEKELKDGEGKIVAAISEEAAQDVYEFFTELECEEENVVEAQEILTKTEAVTEELHKVTDDEKQVAEDDKVQEANVSFQDDFKDTSSCADIFADTEDDSIIIEDEGQTKAEETSKELAGHLSVLHVKLSQSIIVEDDETPDRSDATVGYSPKFVSQIESVSIVLDSEDSFEMLEQAVFKKAEELDLKEAGEIDLTQCNSSVESSATIPYDDSFYSLQQHMKKHGIVIESPLAVQQVQSPIKIDLVSSDEEENEVQVNNKEESDNELFPSDNEDEQMLSQNSTNDEDVIAISDEEINYSIRKYQNNNEDLSQTSENLQDESIDLTQGIDEPEVFSQFEIENHANQSLAEVMGLQESFNINDSIINLLEASKRPNNINVSKMDRSMKALESDSLSDSLQEIMRKYGGCEEKENSRNLRRIQSDSQLMKENDRKSVQFEDELSLSQPSEQDASFNNTIHQSLDNIMSSPFVPRKKASNKKKSLGVQLDDDYLVDIETVVAEPDFKNMTPVELKQALFKYGIRTLPVKKAVQLLEFIYNQIHPKIRVKANEEIDDNDSRCAMNLTDIVTNIGVQDYDDFVFQPGIVDDEDYVLPKMRKSKTQTCAVPLHISFYNMVRSNEKIQKFILEYRPVELDQIHKHFRKFGLSYEPNDIIAFMDKRCITFKTKEKSYSKTYEKKKQKLAQKTQGKAQGSQKARSQK